MEKRNILDGKYLKKFLFVTICKETIGKYNKL